MCVLHDGPGALGFDLSFSERSEENIGLCFLWCRLLSGLGSRLNAFGQLLDAVGNLLFLSLSSELLDSFLFIALLLRCGMLFTRHCY